MAAVLQIDGKETVSERLFKIEQANQRLIEQNRRLAQESRRGHDQAHQSISAEGSALDGLVGKLAGVAAGYFSIQTAINQVVLAMKDRDEQEKRSREVTVTAADAQLKMLRNLGDVTDQQQEDFDHKLQALNARYRPKGGMAALYGEAASGLSASQTNQPVTLAAMEQAMRFAPESAETREELVGGMLDLRKATGSDDMKANLGLLKAAGEQARVVDWANIGKSVGAIALSSVQYGGTAGEGLALWAAVSQASGDKEGRRSANATIKFMEQMEKFLPEKDVYEKVLSPKTGQYADVLRAKGTGWKSWPERLAGLERDPIAKERVLEGLSAEAKQKASLKQIIEGRETTAGKMLTEAQASLARPLPELAAAAETKIQQMQKPTEQKIALAQRTAEAQAEAGELATVAGKRRALDDLFSDEKLDEQLRQSGAGWMERTWAAVKFKAGKMADLSNPDLYAEAINDRLAKMEFKPSLIGTVTTAGAEWGVGKETDPIVLEQREKLRRDFEERRRQGAVIGADVDRATAEMPPQPAAAAPAPAAARPAAEDGAAMRDAFREFREASRDLKVASDNFRRVSPHAVQANVTV